MRNLVLACLAGLAALALAGCGLAERAVESATERVIQSATEKIVETASGISVDTDDGSITITGPEGQSITLSGDSAEGRLVSGFPLPVYEGANVVSSGWFSTDGKTTYSAELSFTGDAVEVADFYEQALKDMGIEVSRAEMEIDGETMVMLSGESDSKSSLITITRKESEKAGTANLLIGDK
ncbi:hypothetical protein [Symbiobacterium terraclitae]|uniref:hypothetical protein n=1 Tax=Symbiobacterium terraclitae TaxID=557451 RepID=UPI0035B53AC8